jgi:protein AroM
MSGRDARGPEEYDPAMPRTLGIVTIGQAPRDDIADLFAAHAPAGTKVVLRGALDGLSDAEVDRLQPENGGDTLYTRLRGGRDVKISKKAVIARSPAALDKLRGDGCDVLVYACTGEFPPMPGDENVLFPSRVLNGLATGLLPRGRLGLLIPLAEQGEKLASKWARPGLEVVAEALAPSAGQGEAAAAAERLAAKRPDLVAMDCMSYTPTTKEWIKGPLGVPALLAITATGRVLREMLD